MISKFKILAQGSAGESPATSKVMLLSCTTLGYFKNHFYARQKRVLPKSGRHCVPGRN